MIGRRFVLKLFELYFPAKEFMKLFMKDLAKKKISSKKCNIIFKMFLRLNLRVMEKSTSEELKAL